MDTYSFDAIGTRWSVTVDGVISTDAQDAIAAWLYTFEQRFSRFIKTAEVHACTHKGVHAVPEDLALLLHRADELRTLTSGVYDPAVASVLEDAGYDASYSFVPRTTNAALASWSIDGSTVTTSGPVTFDFGGMGKGYAIDRVSDILKKHGHEHFLVEAGGDMYGTTKANGDGWNVALAYPGNDEMSIGTVVLRNAALAVSDSFKRQWGTWHHIVSATKGQPIRHVIYAAAVAPTAWGADCMTSVLFMAPTYERAARTYSASYVVCADTMEWVVSDDWDGELF